LYDAAERRVSGVEASNGAQALKLLSLKCFDLVITDFVMPRLNGLKLIKELHSVHPRIPIILMTGDLPVIKSKAIPDGAAEVLPKPFELAILRSTIQRLLRDSSRADTGTLSSVGARMLLRDHPLMMYNGVRSWPPVWVWRGGNDNRNAKGEVGILLDVALSCVPPMPACYLIMEHFGAEYIGTLLLNDGAFCRLVFDVLLQNRLKPLSEIGEIDLSYTL